MTKAECRTQTKRRLAAMTPEQIFGKSHAACHQMLLTPEFQNANAVMLYLSMPGEPELQSLAAAGLDAGKIILLPKVDWSRIHLQAVRVNNFDVRHDANTPLIPQPAKGEIFPLGQIDLIVVPGLAFNESGHRLGRGKGFYDRFLAQPSLRALRAAIAFEEQLFADIPTEPHDVGMQMIVTDQRIIRIAT